MSNEGILVAFLILASGILSLELGISVSVMEILAGVAAGTFAGLRSSDWLEHTAAFGLLGIMFFAGFETDLVMLRRNWRSSLAIGLASFFLPAFLVGGASFFLLGMSAQTSILTAIGLSTTSLALVYADLKRQGLLKEARGQALLGAAMVVDVVSMIALAVLFEGLTVVSLVVLGLVVVWMTRLPRLCRWLFIRYAGNEIELKTRFVLLLLLSLVIASKQASVHVSILAFAAGALLNEVLAEHGELQIKLQSIVFGLVAPVFFFKAGLSVRLINLHTGLLPALAVLGLASFGGKIAGTWLAARRFLPAAEARRAAILFNYQLSFGIVTAAFGLESGIIDASGYLTILVLVISSSLFTTLLARFHQPPAGAAVRPPLISPWE
ncbi:MAG TPA: cation:proton antiporter [Candidatus Ozemobacteraceae bacterium]|nr:cation:proton antiporter [Candidatus Ozemobacteraceae bacterium]